MKAYIAEKARLDGNMDFIRRHAGDAVIYGVIKGNGYGLGLLPMAHYLREQGITRFCVTEVTEVRALREGGFDTAEILMMRETGLEEELEQLLELGAVASVGCLPTAEKMARIALAAGKEFPCHVKIDTGMGRYGFLPHETDAAAQVYRMEGLSVQGIYTHFNSAYDNETATREQFAAYTGILNTLRDAGISVGIRHCCNSSAFLKYPEMHLDAVRLGSAPLGRLAFGGFPELKPVGFCEAQVEVIRQIPAGHSVGYGAGWTAKRPTKIAVFSVGYFHGFGAPARNDLYRFKDCLIGVLSNVKAFLTRKAIYVTVNGKPARVLGHVGMVQTVCDVTDIPCEVDDPVIVDINPLKVKNLPVIFRT